MPRQDMRGRQDDHDDHDDHDDQDHHDDHDGNSAGDGDGKQVRYGQFDMVDTGMLNAKAINLVDEEGRIRGVFGCQDSTVVLALRDRSGFTRLSLNIGDGVVFVNVLGEDEVSRFTVFQQDRAPAVVAVHDANGQARAGMHLVIGGEHAGDGAVTFMGPHGETQAVVSAHTLLGESEIIPPD